MYTTAFVVQTINEECKQINTIIIGQTSGVAVFGVASFGVAVQGVTACGGVSVYGSSSHTSRS